ncbi:MAG: hypothetical protein ACI9QC_000557 [Oceanicoccus sp.]|jgi:hypothetical protein
MPESTKEILGEGYGNPTPNGIHTPPMSGVGAVIKLTAGKSALIYLGEASQPIAEIQYDHETSNAKLYSYEKGIIRDYNLLINGEPAADIRGVKSGSMHLRAYGVNIVNIVSKLREGATWTSAHGPSLTQDHIVITQDHADIPLRVVVSSWAPTENTWDSEDSDSDDDDDDDDDSDTPGPTPNPTH